MAKRGVSKSSGLQGLSVAEIRGELKRRERIVGGLVRRHRRLLDKIATVNEQLKLHGATIQHNGSISGRKRAKNDMNLVQALSKVLSDKVMSVTDVAQAVQDDGYKTTSPSFRTIVNQTLINSGKFKRVERGKYTAK